MKTKYCLQDRIFNKVNHTLLAIFLLAVLYPFIYLISCSFSSGDALMTGKVKLLPVEPTLLGYKTVFAYRPIWSGYLNSLIYMVSGTIVSVVLTIMASYPLSRDDLKGKKFFMGYFLFTMMFNGGLVPTYMLVKQLHMIDTIWAIILPTALSAYNVIVARTFYRQNIPLELLEASRLDGCDDFRFLLKIVIPLSKPIIAVISLWVAVALWNSYFSALIYLNSEEKYPLQLVLRGILIMGSADLSQSGVDPEIRLRNQYLGEMLKYGTIVVSSLPLMILYPFVQKYFVKGVMIGSVKG
ncbi:carbohydrate ABC transporter permease [Ruminiclostridium cellulolyticum]|uniref:Binding-protein-dependent transport systems inner membrane component n=1 Tax=Ruminiclostridium cellulolyticum (strain ATCC 35319 / DSM 5812 / JCM 6584 / H10) TaxID=394503 RepID=B8I9B7_RUMCH|nr:carbohydrate ABC transporter permease [Ruminiclostridium cellulolyticum]ACL75377.1 binding-protein-dependent transport systems inner membrane component [Ruminiclostridium cellulolyticum H10]